MELPKENLDTLQKSIRYSLQDKTLELEAVVNKEISQAKFIQILQKIKKMKHHVAPRLPKKHWIFHLLTEQLPKE